jgi:hypothetical protein
LVLYSLLKTIENKSIQTNPAILKNNKPVYWVNLVDVDTSKNEWRFAYIETDRKNSFIVKNFKADTILDYGNYLLFISYNNLIFNSIEKRNNKVIDSLVFYEEPILPSPIVIHTFYCRIKYTRCKKYKLLGQTVSSPLPLFLSYFTLQALKKSYKYVETNGWSYTYSEQNEKTQAKIGSIIEEGLTKRLKQEDFIDKLVESCNCILVKRWKHTFK